MLAGVSSAKQRGSCSKRPSYEDEELPEADDEVFRPSEGKYISLHRLSETCQSEGQTRQNPIQVY